LSDNPVASRLDIESGDLGGPKAICISFGGREISGLIRA
jgi:hypothetical protein